MSMLIKLYSRMNVLRQSEAIWRRGPRSTLIQIMDCCLMAPSYYLDQYWRTVNWILNNKFQGNLNLKNNNFHSRNFRLKVSHARCTGPIVLEYCLVLVLNILQLLHLAPLLYFHRKYAAKCISLNSTAYKKTYSGRV